MLEHREPPSHGGQLGWAAAVFGGAAADYVDFSANINPLGLPTRVRLVLQEAIEEVEHYPDLAAHAARQALASYLGVPAANVLLTNGGMEALFLAAREAHCRSAVIPVPAFNGYREAAEAADLPILWLPRRPEEIDLVDLPPAALCFLGQPSNPEGRLTPPEVLARLVGLLAERQGTLVLDEAFLDFLPDAPRFSLRHVALSEPSVLVVGSLTKFFALPGLRLGYLVAEEHVVRRLARRLPPWNVNHLAQRALLAALEDRPYQAASRALVPLLRSRLVAGLRALGLFRVATGAANYLLLDAEPSGLLASEWTRRAAAARVLVRDLTGVPGCTPYQLRLAVRPLPEQERLFAVLATLAGELTAIGRTE